MVHNLRVFRALALLVLIGGCAQKRTDVQTSSPEAVETAPLWHLADPEAKARLAAVTAEIKSSPGHSWAGKYVLSNKPTADRIALAPRAGFVLISGKAGSCCKEGAGGQKCSADCPGSREAIYGDVVVTPQGRLRLALHMGPGNIVSAGEYEPRQVNGRHYLIDTEDIDQFEEAVRDSEEPRKGADGQFYLREADFLMMRRTSSHNRRFAGHLTYYGSVGPFSESWTIVYPVADPGVRVIERYTMPSVFPDSNDANAGIRAGLIHERTRTSWE